MEKHVSLESLKNDNPVERIFALGAAILSTKEKELLGKARYLGKRKVEIRFGDPIDLAEFLEKNQLNPKTGVGPLMSLIRERIQALLTK